MTTFLLSYLQPADNLPTWLVIVIFVTPFIVGFGWYFYKTRHARQWRKGIFPEQLKFNDDNLLEAYLSLGALLVLLDYKQTKGKTQFINSYFNRYFPEANYNFGDSLLFSMRHPIQLETVSTWLKNNLKEEAERAQVLYFLSGLALVNGKLKHKELSFLTVITEQLELPQALLKRNISIFEAYFASQQQEEQSKSTSVSRRTSIKEHYRRILGIDSNADASEVKKAFRSLAKNHHPDVFADATPAQQAIAKEKFQQIQEAYEYLMK